MVLQAQLELLDREALWVFLVREESVGCQDFLDLRCVSFFSLSAPPVASNSKVYFSICINVLLIRAHQENRDQQDKLERKDPQDQLAFLVLMDLVVIQVLM